MNMKLLIGSAVAAVSFANAAICATVFSNEALFLAETQNGQTLNFDSVPTGSVLTNEFASLGVSFSSSSGPYPLVNAISPSLPSDGSGQYSGGNFLQAVPRTQGGGNITITFLNPITSFGIWVGDLESFGGATTATFSGATAMTETIIMNSVVGETPLAFGFFGATFDEAISTVSLQIASSDYVLFDDLFFGDVASPPEISPVPLPASGWLLMAGIGGLVARKRIGRRT